MQTKGLPFSFYRTHRSLSMQGSYAAASDIGAHHAAAWLIKADLLGAFPTFQDKARALMTYPRVRLGNDNLGVCKLPWVDVFNPESAKRINEDVYINPASQDIYADFYNGMLGTDLTWEQIFAQTDRDINLQRVMNVMQYGEDTAAYDWIPERAIGPTEDLLYEAEADYYDAEVERVNRQERCGHVHCRETAPAHGEPQEGAAPPYRRLLRRARLERKRDSAGGDPQAAGALEFSGRRDPTKAGSACLSPTCLFRLRLQFEKPDIQVYQEGRNHERKNRYYNIQRKSVYAAWP